MDAQVVSFWIFTLISISLVVIWFYRCKNIKTHPIDNDYVIRKAKQSDIDAINEICANVYYGCDWVHRHWRRILQYKSFMVYGIEYTKTHRIVAVQMIKLHDGGKKASLLGTRTHENHRRKGLMKRLSKFIKKKGKEIHSKLISFEMVSYSSNNASIKLYEKQGFTMMNIKYTFGIITKLNIDTNEAAGMKKDEFTKRFASLTVDFDKIQTKYSYMEGADEIIELMVNKFDLKVINYDWEIYKIKDISCVDDVKEDLQREINNKRLYCLTNSSKNIVCLINIDERPFIQLFFYHNKDVNELDVLVMVRYLYTKWCSDDSKFAINRNFCRFFVDQYYVDRNEYLSKLFDGFDSVVVYNSIANYYD